MTTALSSVEQLRVLSDESLDLDPDNYIGDPCFSRVVELSVDRSRGYNTPFVLKYADYGHPGTDNVLLQFGPMLGSRMLYISMDKLAKERKIRVINPDRFGIGGTDNISADKRLDVWRYIMLLLLEHLNIKHVSMACQSGGIVYALDLILHYPSILHPDRPYLAIGSPWILPSRSGVNTMAMVQAVPRSLISRVDKLVTFINSTKESLCRRMVRSFFGYSHKVVKRVSENVKSSRNGHICNEHTRLESAIRKKTFDGIHLEGIEGISQEALLLLQKVAGQTGWSDWGDYDVLAPRLSKALRLSGRKLILDVYFAERDSMIGDGGSKGPLWFENCWENERDIDYSSNIVPGTNHGGIWMIKFGAIQQILDKVAMLLERDRAGRDMQEETNVPQSKVLP